MRLTLIYGGLFLICGTALLGITYLLVNNATAGCVTGPVRDGPTIVRCVGTAPGAAAHVGPTHGRQVSSGGSNPTMLKLPSGLTPGQARAVDRQMRAAVASQHASEMRQLLIYSGVALAIMAAISVVLGWLTAGRVLRPLRTITAAAKDVSATSLHRRLALDGPDDELKELGDTFDGLLARLEASFAAQRQFVANASHELRTPLALQRTLVQVALADPCGDYESLHAVCERVLTSGAHQERILEALLTLSRGQAGLDKREPFDLATLAGHVLHSREADAQDRQVAVHNALAPALASGDPRLAERLIANLVDNALRHNTTGGYIEIVTDTKNLHAVLVVTNTGPIIPAEAADRLLRPFQRLSVDRTGHGEGLGLGLSIVQAIAQAHGAALTIRPQPGGGLHAEVSFPEPSSPASTQTGADRPQPAEPVGQVTRPRPGALPARRT
ncbi:MAG: HAMP domain-containing histidine kinase [Actinobacteria bacterium]|nr:HAMP domain-containing histidine kinase [Actinomycetota bacterium]